MRRQLLAKRAAEDGTDPGAGPIVRQPRPTFPNYTQIPSRIPVRIWRLVRLASVMVALGIVVALFLRPAGALFAFWRLIIPVVPILLIVAPGVWRNVCPLAAVNQTPRLFGKSRALTSPKWLADHGYVIAIALFLVIVVNRKVVFNTSGPALGVLLIVIFTAAFIGGRTLKGKSGWCSSMCPVLPIQRIYGQTPLVLVRNSHCEPCVGCTKNCYDFNPRVAYIADVYDEDRTFAGYRRWFIGAFPGFVLAYFQVPAHPAISIPSLYGRTALYTLASIAVFITLEVFVGPRPNRLPPMFGAAALAIFYWYTARLFANALGQVIHRDLTGVVWPARTVVAAVAVTWLVRSMRAESMFVEEASTGTLPIRVELGTTRQLRAATESNQLEVTFMPGERVVAAKAGVSLLETAERAGLPIEVGCRMGVCGADPVHVIEGGESLSPITRDEANTLERLGLGGTNRMACSARINGSCRVALRPDESSRPVTPVPTFAPDSSVEHVVVVGGGIAAITAADFVRRHHPTCTIDVVGREAHHLYNRMGISRLIYGRSAMQGLYLLPDDWFDRHGVTPWLNTIVAAIDRDRREVVLGTGQRLPYDRLVLATGSSSMVPEIAGFGLRGCFVMREAQDAIEIRRAAQQGSTRHAVVSGGGLLGLEAAHALRELGLEVTVLERSDRLLRRSLDADASQVLQSYLDSLGIQVATQAEAVGVEGDGRLEHVVLRRGQTMPAAVFVVAAGIVPNVELARAVGIEVGRGVVVDEAMRTSDPMIYAVGDVAEVSGRTWGLWPVAVAQAQVAAKNIAGGDERYLDEVPMTVLKGVGLDMLSFGSNDLGEGDEAITDHQISGFRYRKVVVRAGRVVGGIFLGFPEESVWARRAYEMESDITSSLDALRQGDWPTSPMV